MDERLRQDYANTRKGSIKELAKTGQHVTTRCDLSGDGTSEKGSGKVQMDTCPVPGDHVITLCELSR